MTIALYYTAGLVVHTFSDNIHLQLHLHLHFFSCFHRTYSNPCHSCVPFMVEIWNC